jgi:hypothetical protein
MIVEHFEKEWLVVELGRHLEVAGPHQKLRRREPGYTDILVLAWRTSHGSRRGSPDDPTLGTYLSSQLSVGSLESVTAAIPAPSFNG